MSSTSHHVIPVTEARKNLGHLIDRVKYRREVIALGKHGRADALLIAVPDGDEAVPTTLINASSPSFDFLADEPDLYSRADLKKHHA